MPLSLTYHDDLSRVRIEATGLPDVVVQVQRSLNAQLWMPVRGGIDLPVVDGTVVLDDYEFFPDRLNHYRITTPGPLLSDNFDRTETGGWGTADTGQQWQPLDNPPDFTVSGGQGHIANSAPSVYRRISIGGLELSDSEVLFGERISGLADSVVGGLLARITTPGVNHYEFALDNEGEISIWSLVAGQATQLAGFQQVPGWAADALTWVRVRLAGTELAMSAWMDGTPEPGTWMLTADNSDHQMGALACWHSGIFETSAETTSFDTFTILDPPATVVLAQGQITPEVAGRVWLKSIRHPFLNRPVHVLNWGEVTRASRSGVFAVKGRSVPVAVHDLRASHEFTLTVVTDDLYDPDADAQAQRCDLDLVLAVGGTFLIQVPAGQPIPGGYVTIGDTTEDRTVRHGVQPYLLTLPCTVVAPPGPHVVGAMLTWGAVQRLYGSWEALAAANPTWATLLATVADPEDLVAP